MRLMGLDLGSKTLGIALSDRTNVLATSYKTLHFKNDNYLSLIEELKIIINENDIGKIVLGFPKNMNNTCGERANITIEFQHLLEDELKLPVIMEDERLTSVISNNILIEADISRKKRKKYVDGIAAQIILQSYLDRINF